MHPLPCPGALLPAAVYSSGTLALKAARPRYSGRAGQIQPGLVQDLSHFLKMELL